MEVGEMGRKEPEVEVPLVPATPIKPVPLKPVPIYTPGEINQMGYHANGAVACVEFLIGQEKLLGRMLTSQVTVAKLVKIQLRMLPPASANSGFVNICSQLRLNRGTLV